MRKILKRGLLFLLILILLLAGCSAWAKKAVVSKRGSIKGRSRVFADIAAEKENTLDVLVMGDIYFSYAAVAAAWNRCL